MLGWGELTQSDILLGSTPAVIPDETTALPNMSRLISCSICNSEESVGPWGGLAGQWSVLSSQGSGRFYVQAEVGHAAGA